MFHVKQNKTLSLSNKLAILGEDLATRHLINKGFVVLFRNYLEKVGEIDIICEKDNIIYFVEVKSRRVKDLSKVKSLDIGVFEMITSKKIVKMTKTIELYLLRNNVSYETKWQIIAMGVYVDESKKESKIVVIENIC